MDHWKKGLLLISSYLLFCPDYKTCLLPWQTSIWRPCGSQRTSHSRCWSFRQRMMSEQERRCWPAICCHSNLPQALVSNTLLMKCQVWIGLYCASLYVYKKVWLGLQLCKTFTVNVPSVWSLQNLISLLKSYVEYKTFNLNRITCWDFGSYLKLYCLSLVFSHIT